MMECSMRSSMRLVSTIDIRVNGVYVECIL